MRLTEIGHYNAKLLNNNATLRSRDNRSTGLTTYPSHERHSFHLNNLSKAQSNKRKEGKKRGQKLKIPQVEKGAKLQK